MALEDFVDPEVGVAVVATALVASPQARATVRRGLVYGLANLMRLGNAASSAAQGVATGAQQAASSAGDMVQEASTKTQTPRVTKRNGAGSKE